jgi:bifunctional aspartokinase / homoserine dehydrogenase 1
MTTEKPLIGFGGLPWQVHKFGGTSVANAECFLLAASIVEEQLGLSSTSHGSSVTHAGGSCCNTAVVVSAMGGKPKVTDLLLDSVKAAAQRDKQTVEASLVTIVQKHETCLRILFEAKQDECDRLINIVQCDIEDIRDILKTVALMKWQAQRISELVSGYGELWSAQILTALLSMRSKARFEIFKGSSSSSLHEATPVISHEFVYMDARRVITIDEDAIQDGAVAWDESAKKMEMFYLEEAVKLSAVSQMLHFVVTGYVASNTEGVSTTLQRDGSDYSAAIIGKLLQSNSITIWTDVDGVLSADPRRVPLAQVLSEVSYSEAMELAYFGAKVIHPKTMQPAIQANPQIPIFIRNTFNSSFRGTRIFTSSPTHKDREMVVCGFTSIEHMALLNVEGSGLIGVPGVGKRIFGTLEHAGVSVVLISQASSEHSITFATIESDAVRAKAAIEEEFSRELKTNRISGVDLKSPCSIIAAVGDAMSQTAGVSGKFFSALGDAKINILAIAQGCSERNISAVVATKDSTRALRAVHAAFRLSHTTIRVGIIGMNDLGLSLLKLLQDQRSTMRTTFDIDLQVVVVLATSDSNEAVCLKKDSDGGTDSISVHSFDSTTGGSLLLGSPLGGTEETGSEAIACDGGLPSILQYLFRNECTNHVIFDCTNSEAVGKFHSTWLRAGVDVVTANNTGLSGSKEQRDEISRAEKAHGKQSAKYLRDVTVGGGLPVVNTARTLLQTGDKIRRVDGILSVSLSFIMFRVSPPSDIARCSKFDERYSNGAFRGDLLSSPSNNIGAACSFSQAVKEAIALGLMEEDPTKDLNNEYTSRVLMVLARELGIEDAETLEIQNSSDKLLDGVVDFNNLPPDVDEKINARVKGARSRGCVLRYVSSVDVAERRIETKIVEVPDHHILGVTPPSCECVRFFTHRHRRYPLIIQGPSAGADSTASALLAEVLQLMRGKASPRSVALSRTGTSVALSTSCQG